MVTVRELLERKGRQVHTIGPDETVYEALRRMAEHEIGALVVLEGHEITGMLSERDYARKVILEGKFSKDIPVREIMSTNITFVTSHHSVEACMALMTRYRFRHLPVVDNDRMVGLVSIGDVVRAIIEEQQFDIDQLYRYIQNSSWANRAS